MTSIRTHVQAGERLHLWMKPADGASVAELTINLGGADAVLTVAGPTDDPLPVSWQSPASGEARIAWSDDATAVSLAYTFDPAAVTETGIRILWTCAAAAIDPARHQFHFRPSFGWMNDPNGLCEVAGVTHIFYQHNPHARRWNTMHWGHAISRDGISWVHLPIAMNPREELVRGAHEHGGAFSGTALPRPDGTMRLFYTDRQDSRLPTREWQVTAVVADGLSPGPSTPVLDAHPPVPSFQNDWRDPFVFPGPDGRLKMLLGGADATGSLVLLYETDDVEGAAGWRFVDVMFRQAARRTVPAECPCMIRLDRTDLWVLIFGLIGSRDEATRRRNLTRTHVGRFDGRVFEPLYEHELDFGTDCYAMQVWRGADGPRGIAWAANWTDVFADRDFESAMTLPRRLIWQDGHLSTPPVEAVDSLRVGTPAGLGAGSRVLVADGLAEVVLAIQPGTPFTLALEHPTHDMTLTYDGRTLEFHYEPPGNRIIPRYRTPHPDLRNLRLFIDVGLIEIYADHGRACCTKRIDSSLPVTAMRLGSECLVEAAEVWSLKALGRRCESR